MGQTPHRYRFGPFELDPRSGQLRKDGVTQQLHEQPLHALLLLIERPGDVVTREELRRQLWREDTFVDFEQGLNSIVKRLREALGDVADNPVFIQTLPRRGYRFLARVEALPNAESTRAASSDASPPSHAQRSRSPSHWLL